jgi:hypothetical protein
VRGIGLTVVLRAVFVGVAFVLLFPCQAFADTTIGFDDLAPGTTVTTQYADSGGAGQGVTFGPLPGGAGNSISRPVITSVPGQAHSGTRVADITCTSCNEGLGSAPDTTGTFATQRSHVSVYVGFLGAAAPACSAGSTAGTCAVVTLRAFDSIGNQVAASAPATLTQGAGVATLLSVSTMSAEIVGFEVSGRDPTDNNKDVAIDDLSFDNPSTPPSPDFTLTPAATSLNLAHGQSVNDQITIGRIAGSSGGIQLDATGLPAGVHAQFSPDPADAGSTLTLSADRTVQPSTGAVTITGTPLSASAGSSPRSFQLSIQVRSACSDVLTTQDLIDAINAACKVINVDDNAYHLDCNTGRPLPGIDLAQLADCPAMFQGYNPASNPDSVLTIPDGVTLESDRSATKLGGQLEMLHDVHKNMLAVSAGVRITGLRLEGYLTSTEDQGDITAGIDVRGVDGVLIDNNEIYRWPGSGVSVDLAPNVPAGSNPSAADYARAARRIRITQNFIHNNAQCGYGYGVVVNGTGYALIDRNVFDFNRHDVSADGSTDPHGYLAELNFLLSSGPTCKGNFNQHFDVHGSDDPGTWVGGTAGQYIEIRDNAIRGAQRYGGFCKLTRPAFDLRGKPSDKAVFADNVLKHPDVGTAIRIELRHITACQRRFGSLNDKWRERLERQGRLFIESNKYGVDTTRQLAVGDF